MAYQSNQPLGSSTRGGGGGWRALSFLNTMDSGSKTTGAQDAAMEGGSGPLSKEAAAKQLAERKAALGLGASVYDRAASDLGFQNAYAGYTAGTGATGGKASGNSY